MFKNLLLVTALFLLITPYSMAENVSKWDLNDHSTASSAVDSINGFNGVKEGNVTFEKAGALSTTGTSAGFDGSSILEVPYNTTLNPDGSFSVSAWVKPTGGTGTTRSFVSSRAAEKHGYIVRIESNNKFRFYVGAGDANGGWQSVEGPTVTLDTWYHVLATFESQSVTDGVHTGISKLFVNGQLVQFKTLKYIPNTSAVRPFRIGGSGDKNEDEATVYNFVGDIDEVEFHSGIVTAEEINSNFDQTTGMTREIFYQIPNHGVDLIKNSPKYPWFPDVVDHVSLYDSPSQLGDEYGARLRGYITIPEDGTYQFVFSSDDRGELLLSFDGTLENLQKVATVPGYTSYRQFDKYTEQTSAVFNLTAGQVLYSEAFFKEHQGGDHMSVAWIKNGAPLEIIPASALTPFVYNFTEQQQILTSDIAAAQALYDQSASNIGSLPGQYSESSRINFQLAIAAAQNSLNTELSSGRKLAYAIYLLEQATQEFSGGIKPTKILGKSFGTTPAWTETNGFQTATDGDISTFFDYLLNNGGYTGIIVPDGREVPVEVIRYHPRNAVFNRMVGGKFQGSVDGVTYTDLYTITEEPVYQWYEVQITDSTPYKYLRYIGPNNSHCNIAEVEFLGYQTQELYMLYHEIVSVKANTADQFITYFSLTAEHGGLFPQFLTYKVLELPTHGILKLNGVDLTVDATFTQDDINNGLLTFSADTSRLDDSFKVEITSTAGGILPEVIVDLMIDSDSDGLSDQQEISLGTDYDNADTNNNGISDSWEVENGLDPVADTLSPMVDAIEGENGLSASYFYGRFSKISDFSSKSPAKVTKITQINFNQSYWGEFANSGAVHDVGAKFIGYIYIPVEGNYKFILSSDDGSNLYVDGAKIITNDGLHSFEQVSAVVNLSAGFHPIKCEYFEAGGHHGVVLEWEGPSRARQVVPASFLFLSIPEHQALIDSIDSDQDGLTDLLEATVGSDPQNPDTDGDRLLDGEEYHATYGYQTLTTNVDTDGDTVSDYDEIFIFHSNPLIPDFDGTVQDEIIVKPKNTLTRVGEWQEDGDEVFAKNRRGSLEYNILVPTPGLFRLDIEAAQNVAGSSRTNFDLHLYVDGEFVARQEQQIEDGEVKTYSYMTTNLRAGYHKIKIFWENVYQNTSLRVKSIKLTNPGGPDNNENGQPDWIDSYVSSLYSLENYSAQSLVSPAQIEGKGRYLSKFLTSFADPVQQGTYNRWFADVTLSKTGPTAFSIEFEHGLNSTTGSITWAETNILSEGTHKVKAGSSMLLNAVIDGDLDGSSIITVTKDGTDELFNAAPEEPVEYKFTSAGTYTITAEYTGSELQTKTMTVTVIDAPDVDAPFVWRAKERFWKWDGLSEEVKLEAFGMQFTPTTDGFNIKRQEILENINIVARMGEGGPIIKSLPTKAFWLRDVVEGHVFVVETLEDGTRITNDTAFGVNIPEGMEIKVNTISGVTFPDGSRNMSLYKEDFDSLNRYTIELIKTPDRTGANCHWYKVYQNGIFVGQHNQ